MKTIFAVEIHCIFYFHAVFSNKIKKNYQQIILLVF